MNTLATPRISPATAPFAPEIQAALEKIMPPGQPPLVLFTTLARDPRLFSKFFASSLLDRGHLTLRQRELVINRTTARCKSEYEWGVHITIFAAEAKFDETQIASFVHGGPADSCWSEEDRLLLRLCDALHEQCTIADDLWASLRTTFSEAAMLELLILAGFYRTVSYLTNALQLPLEPNAARLPMA